MMRKDFLWGAFFGSIVGLAVYFIASGISASLALSFGLAVYLGFILGKAV